MYDELVATLRRQCAEMDCGNCETCVKRQAADAIEELLIHLQNAINWTVVEKDGLPSVPGEYLVYVRAGTDFKKPDTELDFDLNEVLDYVTTAYFDTDTCLWKENDEYYNGNLACVNKEKTYYISHWADKPKPPKEDKPYGN